MIDKTIRFLYYSLFFVSPLLMFSFTSELFEFNKLMFIYLMAIAISFLWLLKSFREKRFFVRRTLLDIPILIFLGTQILSTLFSIDRHTSLFGYYGRFNGGLVSTLAFVALFYGFVTLFPREKWEKLLKWTLLSSLLVILWGLPARFGWDLSCYLYTGQLNNECWTDQFRPAERMFSTLGQPNWLGAYLAINFFIGLYFWLRSLINTNAIKFSVQKFLQIARSERFLYAAYLVLNFCALLFTRSRSALIATVIGLTVFASLVYFSKDRQRVFKNSHKPVRILLVVFLLAVLVFKTGVARIDRFIPFNGVGGGGQNNNQPAVSSEISESFDIRKIVWKGAWELGKRYPLFGTGVETFAYSYYFVRPQEHNLTSEWDYVYNKAHNEYLNFLATTGFLGIGAYLLVLGTVIYVLLKKIGKKSLSVAERLLYTAIGSSYVAILITNFFGFSTTTINLFFFILIPGFVVTKELVWEKEWPRKYAFYIFAASNLFLFYLLVSWIFYYAADASYAKGNSYYSIGDYQQSALHYGRAISMRYEPVYEDKYSYSLANLAFIASYQNQSDLVPRLIDLSVFYNNRTKDDYPEVVTYWKTRGKNDYLIYQINLETKYLEDGIDSLNQAQKIAPTDPKLPYSLAIYYSLLQDDYSASDKPEEKQKAVLYKTLSLNNINQSIRLKPDYRDAYYLKAQLEKKYGNDDQAREALEFILKNIDPQDKEASEELNAL